MSALVVIPWHSTDPWRIKAMHHVTNKLGDYGLTWCLSPSPVEPFSRAAAKNFGVREFLTDEDVIIFHDADMLLKPEKYEELETMARESGQLIVGFNEYRALTLEATALVLNGSLQDPWLGTTASVLISFSVGGIVALTVELFNEIGGYDERFRGWGCEDFGFAITAGVLRGGIRRLEGSAVHLFHEHGSATQDPADELFNGALLRRYNQITNVDDLRVVQRTD